MPQNLHTHIQTCARRHSHTRHTLTRWYLFLYNYGNLSSMSTLNNIWRCSCWHITSSLRGQTDDGSYSFLPRKWLASESSVSCSSPFHSWFFTSDSGLYPLAHGVRCNARTGNKTSTEARWQAAAPLPSPSPPAALPCLNQHLVPE